MLLQTNSYFVPKDKRVEHARLLRRFRTALARVGCDHFEVYEQVGSNWNMSETTGRFVQIMRFRDKKHQHAVQAAEAKDTGAQAVIAEFCNLVNFPYQQQQGLFAVGFYTSVLPVAPLRAGESAAESGPAEGTRSPTFNPPPTSGATAKNTGKQAQNTQTMTGGMVGGVGQETGVAADQGFGQTGEGDFEEAMQRLRPIDIGGQPVAEPGAKLMEPEAEIPAAHPIEATSSDDPNQPSWNVTAELVEANELGAISEEDALAELESEEFSTADIVPDGASEPADVSAESTETSAEGGEAEFETGDEVELSAEQLNSELAHPDSSETTIDDDTDDANPPRPGGRAWR